MATDRDGPSPSNSPSSNKPSIPVKRESPTPTKPASSVTTQPAAPTPAQTRAKAASPPAPVPVPTTQPAQVANPIDAAYAYNGDIGFAPGSAELIRRRFAHSPAMVKILVDDDLIKEFEKFEANAKGRKRRFHRIGVLSLIAAGLGLAAGAVELMANAYLAAPQIIHLVSAAGAGLAIVGLVVAVTLTFVLNDRKQWLDNRYYAERLRQWHFDTLLDSRLTALASTDPVKFAADRKRQLDEFCDLLKRSRHAWSSMPDDQLIEPNHETKLLDSAHPLQKEIWEAFCWLRLDHQWRHWGIKIEPDDHLAKLHDLVKGISRTCFQIAILATFVQAATIAALGFGWLRPAPWVESMGIAMAGVQLLLLTVSVAFERADNGLGLSKEMEHYQRMAMIYMGIKDRASRAAKDEDRFEIMRNVEVWAKIELKDFLKIHERASFLL